MAEAQRISKDWNAPVIVAATGPSLTDEVVWTCRKARWFGPYRIVCVSDAYRRFANADLMYSCDEQWWDVHKGAAEFRGEKWSSHDDEKGSSNNKSACADKYGLKLVRGKNGVGFSTNPDLIHYGHNSGFQAVNLAILKGATKIVLVGFDMREVDGQRHFFGNHPAGLRSHGNYGNFIGAFRNACPPPVPIINATPGSALDCFPMVELKQALEDHSGSGDRPLDYPTTSRDCPQKGGPVCV